MTEVDPYNYPFPHREQTMYLQTISQTDTGFQKVKIFKPETTSLKTNDISGANPILPGYRYSQKETYVNRTNDIDGCFPKKLIRENISRTVFNLKNDDIKGTQPQISKFLATRHVNPLAPEYKLPSAQIKVSTPPKFIRDSINITDIDGTRPNPYNLYKLRKTHVYEEVEGSKPKKLFVPKDQINILDVRDINEYLQFKTSRVTNPLNPVYVVPDEDGKKMEIGEIEFSKSRQLHPVASKRDPSLDLKTKDIDGAWAGTHSEKFLRRNERKHYIQTLKVDDIQGAQVSTLKKGITTNRRLNPIWPFEAYPYLGAKEDLSEKIPEKTGSIPKSFGHHKRPVESKSGIFPTEKNDPLKTDGIKESATQPTPSIVQAEAEKISPVENKNPPSHNSRKSSGTQKIVASANTIQKNGENIVNNASEQIQVAATNNIAVAEQPKNEQNAELKFYQGTKEAPANSFKTKLTTAQNFDKFIRK